MIKLYKNNEGKLHYWEMWETDEDAAVIHWGIVGDKGQMKEVKSTRKTNYEKVVQREFAAKVENGFAEFDENNFSSLEIEYKIDGFGTKKNLNKRHDLEDFLSEILGWTGLGHVDGGSIGSGTMEVGCRVVDFEIAKSVIETDLKNTEFGNYSRIYKME